jgi:type IV pilus assembly protein PilF
VDRKRALSMGLCAALALSLLSGCTTARGRAENADRARRATAHLNLGMDHLQSGRSALGLRELLVAESLDPTNPLVQGALGEAYFSSQKLKEAESHFLNAIRIDPDYHEATLSLSALYIVLARYEETIALCAGLADDPTFPGPSRALANLGWAQFQLGRLDEARKAFAQALEFNDKYWPAMLSMATLEAHQGRRMEAIAMLQRVIDLSPGPRVEAEANYRLAENYIALGRRDRAVGHLTTAVARAPDGEWGRRSEEYLKLLH